MRIASNKIADILRFFREELKDSYENEELETIMAYCFEEYLGIKRAGLTLRINDTVSESELLKFNFAVKDLKKHKPIQYILGKADFYGLKFNVNKHVLIPRPETEELVDLIVKEFKVQSPKSKVSILDIGTGSGCISITLKKHIPSAEVQALDISEKALETARENAKLNQVEIDFVLDDVLNPNSNFRTRTSLFDIIVSNPPYVCNSEKEQIQKNVLDYEPHLALFVGDTDPLLFYKAITGFGLKYLKPGGKLYLEINEAHGEETKLLLESNGFKNAVLIKDINNKNRILRGTI